MSQANTLRDSVKRTLDILFYEPNSLGFSVKRHLTNEYRLRPRVWAGLKIARGVVLVALLLPVLLAFIYVRNEQRLSEKNKQVAQTAFYTLSIVMSVMLAPVVLPIALVVHAIVAMRRFWVKRALRKHLPHLLVPGQVTHVASVAETKDHLSDNITVRFSKSCAITTAQDTVHQKTTAEFGKKTDGDDAPRENITISKLTRPQAKALYHAYRYRVVAQKSPTEFCWTNDKNTILALKRRATI